MIAEPRITLREPIQGGELVIHYAMSSRELAGGPKRNDPQPGPGHAASSRPPGLLKLNGGGRRSGQLWEAGAPALRLLAAAIADALAGRPWDGPIMQSVWLRVQAEAEGRVGLNGRNLPAWCDPALRRALVGPSALDLVLGYTNDGGEDVIGLAELTPPERDAVEWWLSPPSSVELEARDESETGDPWHRTAHEIRDLMDRRRRRRGMPLAISTVESYLSRARGKLRAAAVREAPLDAGPSSNARS